MKQNIENGKPQKSICFKNTFLKAQVILTNSFQLNIVEIKLALPKKPIGMPLQRLSPKVTKATQRARIQNVKRKHSVQAKKTVSFSLNYDVCSLTFICM